MEERGNKTIMCNVFFLDIVGYSKKSVTGQISLKERFNSYLSAAIRDVPVIDRIILDTGDGAAINFLGDIEDALKAALSLRESLLSEDPNIEHPLLVRMGINLGPVRLVRDINGQPNIVGDGINVAQRVMSFADASQILVSRSYYDAVSRVSPQYAGMFHYQGSRTDKHVREHEVYAIGYPGDKTTLVRAAQLFFERSEGPLGNAFARVTEIWRSVLTRQDGLMGLLNTGFWRAKPMQRVFYVGVGSITLLLLIVLLVKLADNNNAPTSSAGMDEQAASKTQTGSTMVWDISQPGSSVTRVITQSSSAVEQVITQPSSSVARVISKPSSARAGVLFKHDLTVAPVSSVAASTDVNTNDTTQSQSTFSPEIQQIIESTETKGISKPKRSKVQPQTKFNDAVVSKSEDTEPAGALDAYLSVHCIDGAEIFIDGTRKGRISGSSITINATPGTHTVIVSHPQGVDSRNVVFEVGKTVRFNPYFCN